MTLTLPIRQGTAWAGTRDPNSPAYRPFPSPVGADTEAPPDTSASVISNYAVAMKNVESSATVLEQ